MADVLKIACVQTDIIARNPSENFRHLDELFAKIQDDRDIIILPETFTTGFPAEPELFAEDENGPTMTWLRQKAKERNCVICGSFITSFSQQPYHNTLVWMNPDGTYHTYNKRHTFMGGEKEQLRCGQDLVTINYKGWKIRPFVCYDLRFPVWLRNTYKGGEFEYDLAILIANWPQPKAYIWNTLLSARAIENQAYFIGVNRVGTDHNNVPYIGGTKIVNAKGRTVAEIAGDKENILEAEIDMESMSSFRNHFIVHKDWDDFKIV